MTDIVKMIFEAGSSLVQLGISAVQAVEARHEEFLARYEQILDDAHNKASEARKKFAERDATADAALDKIDADGKE